MAESPARPARCEACSNLGTVDGCERCGRVCAQPAPGSANPRPAFVSFCKCGIARADCDYHRAVVEPPAPYPWGYYG